MNTAIKFRIDLPTHELSTNPAQTQGRAISKIFSKCARNLYAALAFAVLACMPPCQEISRIEPTQADPHMKPESSDASEHESRHILGSIPNYRTFPSLYNYEPLTSREKFKIASEDSLDRGTFALGALFGGLGQVTDGNKAFGQGAGFGRYFGAAYGDLLTGNYMSEAVCPSGMAASGWAARIRRSRMGVMILEGKGRVWSEHGSPTTTPPEPKRPPKCSTYFC